MYDKVLATTGAAAAGGLWAVGGPMWLTLAGFAIVATGTAVARILPRRIATK